MASSFFMRGRSRPKVFWVLWPSSKSDGTHTRTPPNRFNKVKKPLKTFFSDGSPKETGLALVLIALLFAGWATFFHLGDFPLLSPDEGRNAEVAREMKVDGRWLVPTYDGAVYLDKPAFFFKATALSLAAFGDNEAAARLPSALSAFALLVLLLVFCQKVYGRLTAAMALVVVASTPLFMAFSRIVIFDMMLALWVSAAILLAYLAEEVDGAKRRQRYLLATLCAGLATLVKGPVGFLVPLLVMAVFHGLERHGRAIRSFFHPWHILLFLGVVLPWFIGLSIECPDFPYYGIMKESIARFTTTEFRRTQPTWYYAAIIGGCFFTWSTLLPGAIHQLIKRRFELHRADRLFIVWALVVVIFFSLSQSKLPGYILTGVIALGVLVARILARALEGGDPVALSLVRRGLLTLFILSLILLCPLLMFVFTPEDVPKPRWLTPGAMMQFAPVIPGFILSLGATTVMALIAFLKQSPRGALVAYLIFPVLLLTLNFGVIPRHAEIKSGHSIVNRLPPALTKDTEIACLACMPPGVPFYLGRLMTVFTEEGRELTSNYVIFSLASGKSWPPRLVPWASRDAYLETTEHPLFLMATGERRDELVRRGERVGAPVVALANGYFGVLLPPGNP